MYYKKQLLILGIFLLSCHGYAANENISCPPLTLLKANSAFNHAQSPVLNLRFIYTDPYPYNKRNWVTLFYFQSDIKTNTEILKYGHQLFNQAIISDHPVIDPDGNTNYRIICDYPNNIPNTRVSAIADSK